MKFKHLSASIECSAGRTPTVKTLCHFIRMLSDMGYTELYLGLTDAYKMEGEPYFNYKRGGYTTEDLRALDAYAKERGIELIATIQTLGHLDYLERHESYRDMMDTHNILMVGDERVYALVDKMFATMSKGLSSRRIHIGFDECYGLGTGNYLKKNGPADKKELLLRHLRRVVEIASKYGYTCEIWHDMLIETDNTRVTSADVRAALPEGVRVWYWEYWEKDEATLNDKILNMKKYADNLGFAGTAFKCGSMAPLNAFSMARLLPGMKQSVAHGIDAFMVTLWSDNGAWVSNYSVLPCLYACAEYARGTWDGTGKPDAARFERITGGNYDELWSLDFLDDPFELGAADCHSNRTFWILLSDLLFGGWDLMIRPDTPDTYRRLSERYAAVYDRDPQGPYAHVFRAASGLALVLAEKATLGVGIRAAYKNGDKSALTDCLSGLKKLREALDAYIPVYEDAWNRDNQPHGLELDQLFLGGEATRLAYIERRIRAFIDRDEPITELDTETVRPDMPASVNEESYWNSNLRTLYSNCGM